MDESFLINGIKTKNKIVFDFIFHYYCTRLCAFAERITKNQFAAGGMRIFYPEKNYFLPIPHDLIARNPDKMSQNPNY